jgi:hypothetical protein
VSVNILLRVRDLMFRPGTAWEEIKTERSSTARILFGYVAVLAAAAVVERMLLDGYRHLVIESQAAGNAIWSTFWQNAPFFIIDLLNIYLAGRIANGLYPPPADDPVRGLRLVAYAATPLWIARIVVALPWSVFPWLALAAALYFPYLLYRGIAVLLERRSTEAAWNTAVLALATAVVVGIVNYIVYLFVVL